MTIPIDGHRLSFEPDADMAPWWREIAAERLVVRACIACGHAFFPPYSCCPRCHSFELGWRECRGTGVIHSFTVVVAPTLGAFAEAVPYVVGLIELDEFKRAGGAAIRMLGLIDEPEPVVHIGAPVGVHFMRVQGAPYPLPTWTIDM